MISNLCCRTPVNPRVARSQKSNAFFLKKKVKTRIVPHHKSNQKIPHYWLELAGMSWSEFAAGTFLGTLGCF
jgi:hypothetical protein